MVIRHMTFYFIRQIRCFIKVKSCPTQMNFFVSFSPFGTGVSVKTFDIYMVIVFKVFLV